MTSVFYSNDSYSVIWLQQASIDWWVQWDKYFSVISWMKGDYWRVKACNKQEKGRMFWKFKVLDLVCTFQFLTRPQNSNKNFPFHVRTSQVCLNCFFHNSLFSFYFISFISPFNPNVFSNFCVFTCSHYFVFIFIACCNQK